MKGNAKVLKQLNELLADELTAINQYFVHAEMCEDWGYGRLHDATYKRAIGEMKHAEKLIERILFLEGKPIVSKLNPIHIGADVLQQIKNDANAEMTAIKMYNQAIKQAVEAGDNGSRDLLQSILNDEEEHLDWLEEQQDQIEQMGMQIYLTQQIKE
jgi:bacterioferritin